MTIGERLEEARKRKGVSVREAAEATKVRGDFLAAMEANKFEEIKLPVIYVRGFLKIYARFLKVEPEKIVIDFDARLARLASSEASQNASRESLGRMEISDEENESGDEANNESGHSPRLARPNVNTSPDLESARPRALDGDNALYIKIAVIGGSIGVVALLLVLLVSLIRSPDGAPPPEDQPPAMRADARPPESAQVVLRATGDVTVIVEQVADRHRLFQGSLNAGDAVSLDREGPISIRFTDGEALVIERDGREVSIGAAGPGRTRIE